MPAKKADPKDPEGTKGPATKNPEGVPAGDKPVD